MWLPSRDQESGIESELFCGPTPCSPSNPLAFFSRITLATAAERERIGRRARGGTAKKFRFDAALLVPRWQPHCGDGTAALRRFEAETAFLGGSNPNAGGSGQWQPMRRPSVTRRQVVDLCLRRIRRLGGVHCATSWNRRQVASVPRGRAGTALAQRRQGNLLR